MWRAVKVVERNSRLLSRIIPATKDQTFPMVAVLTAAMAGILTSESELESKQPCLRQHLSVSSAYQVGGILGEGGFAKVTVGRHKKSNTQVAIKKMSKRTVSEAQFRQEVDILRQVGGKHNIIELREAFETKDAYVIVTEVASGGELYERLVNEGTYGEAGASRIIKEAAAALAFLHSKDIVHADVKPENFVLTSTKDSAQLRLIDFGLAFRTSDSLESQHSFADGSGTVAYSAPELLARKAGGCKADVWSLGVVLYILLAGAHPFDLMDNASTSEIKARILLGDYNFYPRVFRQVSAEAQDLIRKMLVVDPEKRLTAAQVLQHPWIVNLAGECNVKRTMTSRTHARAQKNLFASLSAVLMASDSTASESWVSSFGQEKELDRALNTLDPVQKGYIDANDLRRAVERLGRNVTESEINEMVQMAGPNGDHIQYFDIERIIADFECKSFKKEDVIFQAGDAVPQVYVVMDGEIECSITQPKKKKIVLDLMKPGSILDPAATRMSTARCTSESCRVLQLQPEDLDEISNEFAHIDSKVKSEKNLFLRQAISKYIASGVPGTKLTRYNTGEAICRQGNSCDKLYVVRSGQVEVVKELDDGNIIVIEALGVGDFFPLGIYDNRCTRDATVRCNINTELVEISGEGLRKLMDESPSSFTDSLKQEIDRRREAREKRL